MKLLSRYFLTIAAAGIIVGCDGGEKPTVAPISAPPTEVSAPVRIAKSYRVSADYRNEIAAKAYQKTGDPEFLPPANPNGTVTWDPRPSTILKRLGLDLRKGYAMALHGDGIFDYLADQKGHEELVALHRSIGIPISGGQVEEE